MPHANEIEEAVLGALLNDSNAIDECMMILNDSKVFYKESHKFILKQ
jgi:replicative DNA helicase